MKKREVDQDQIVIKHKKGTWKRFVKLFPKCRLPWIWLVIYIVLDLGVINIGLSETEYTAELFAGNTSAAFLAKLIAIIVLNLVSTNFVVFARQMVSAMTDRNMRGVLLEKVMRLPMSYFKNENPREAIYRIVANSTVISNTVLYVVFPIITAAYTAFSVFGRVFQHDWRLSIILIVFIPVQLFIAFIFGRIDFSLSNSDATVHASLMQKLAELITNIPLAKAFAKEDKETESGELLTKRIYKINIKSSWMSQFRDLSETFVDLLQSVIMVLVGIALLKDGGIDNRAWIAFFMFSSVFSGSIAEFMMYYSNLKNIQGSANRVAEIMNAPEEDFSGDPCEDLRGSVKLEHVQFGYDEEKPVLTDISCEFRDNSVTALLGVSGCGKTTLVNLLTRLYVPQSGEILIEDKSVHGYALTDYRSQFVMVSQNSMLFSGSIRENVCYGNGEVTDEAFEDALKKAGAYDFISKLPDGADTRLEEYGNNLSGGQRQRIAVARALLSNAHYIILDEPAASMDAIAASELMGILKNISNDRCMIIIAHTAAVLPLADNVVIIENGVVSAQGETAEVLKTNDFLREFAGKKVTE